MLGSGAHLWITGDPLLTQTCSFCKDRVHDLGNFPLRTNGPFFSDYQGMDLGSLCSHLQQVKTYPQIPTLHSWSYYLKGEDALFLIDVKKTTREILAMMSELQLQPFRIPMCFKELSLVWFSQPFSSLKYSCIKIEHFSLILPKLLMFMFDVH